MNEWKNENYSFHWHIYEMADNTLFPLLLIKIVKVLNEIPESRDLFYD